MSAEKCDVMVVDDQPPIRQIVGSMLRRFGLEGVVVAEDGAQALAMLTDLQPRLLISDVNMPVMNGLELVKRVRSGDSPAPRDLPVLMLTGHGESPVVSTALALDVNGFVLKPASPANLKLRVDRALAAAAARPALKGAAFYRNVPIPDVTLMGATMPAPSKPAALPGTRVVPLDSNAVGKTMAAPITAADGDVLLEAGQILSTTLAACLEDLVAIGVVAPEIVVRDDDTARSPAETTSHADQDSEAALFTRPLSDDDLGYLLDTRQKRAFDATLAALAYTSVANGRVTPEERHILADVLRLAPRMRGYDLREAQARFDLYTDGLFRGQEGVDRVRMDILGALEDRQHRARILRFCLALARVDGEVGADEQKSLRDVAEWLDMVEPFEQVLRKSLVRR